MSEEHLVVKLMRSFDELDRCIEITKAELLAKDNMPADVLARVEQYSAIVDHQRSLAGELQTAIHEKNWDEISRLVRLINGMSVMIRDDAQSILNDSNQTPSHPTKKPEPSSRNIC